MNLTVIRTKDWVSIAEEDMGIRATGTDYIYAFTAFGFAIQSHELVLDKWDKQFEQDVLSGKLDRLSKEAIKEHRAAIVEQ